MAHTRLIYHPVLRHKRSRTIFLLFFVVSALVGALVWLKFSSLIDQAGLTYYSSQTARKWYLVFLLSPHFKYSLILASGVIGGALTAHYVVGPVKRIEQWCMDWERGLPLNELRVREGDKFSIMVRLINELYKKTKST